MGGLLFDISQETINPMHPALEVIRHRGPNRCGVRTFPEMRFNINIGGRHYPVTDLTDTGWQPISYEDGDCWIMLDGEIYNYREVRRQLLSEGYAFKSESDAEVFLAAYCRWGSKCLKILRGMYAVCIYHHARRSFFLARDPVGMKPLYFVNRHDCFRAGSEIKQFFSIPGFVPQVNNRMLYYYLATGLCRKGCQTLWHDVYELAAGYYIETSLDTWAPGQALQSHCWYKYNYEVDEKLDFEESIAEYRRLFFEIMQEQQRHDYPGGYRLTGDISTAVTASIGAQLNKNNTIKTYSLSSESNYPDHMRQVEQIRKNFKSEEHLVDLRNKDFLLEFDRMIYANDFPVEFNRNLFNWMLYNLDGSCRERIIIDGEGAGQFLFSDIDFYWAFVNRKMYNSSAAGVISDLRHLSSPGRNPWLKVFDKLRNMTFGHNQRDSWSVINKNVLLANGENAAEYESISTNAGNSLMDFAIADIMHMTENLLFLDRCSALGNCELRHPYLDLRLIELSLKMPLNFKLAEGKTKVILRESFRDLLPSALIASPDFSEDEFVSGAKWQKRLFHTLLLANIDDILREPYVLRNELVKIVHKFTLSQRAFSPVIWRLIAINRWKKAFNLS